MKRDLNWECYPSLNPRIYAGKYVVIAEGKLVGAGKNLGALLCLARRKRLKKPPFVARMRDPRKLCVYRIRRDGLTA